MIQQSNRMVQDWGWVYIGETLHINGMKNNNLMNPWLFGGFFIYSLDYAPSSVPIYTVYECTTQLCFRWLDLGKSLKAARAWLHCTTAPSHVYFGGRPLAEKCLARKGLRSLQGPDPLLHVAMNKWIRGELNIHFTKEKESCALNPTPPRLKCCMTLR